MPDQTASPAYVIGVDYGTDSVRALLVNARTGAEVAQAVHYYPRWQQRRLLQRLPRTSSASTRSTTSKGLKPRLRRYGPRGQPRADVVGLAVDTTGSTPGPVNADGVALALHPELC
ncbi:MAG: hypothetical protein WKG07_11995 [Hymenobacter sp.]